MFRPRLDNAAQYSSHISAVRCCWFRIYCRGRNPNLLSRTCENFSKLCEDGRLHDALLAAEVMQKNGIPIIRNDAYHLLQQCEKSNDLKRGKRVQSLMVYSALDSIAVLGDYLVRLFVYHGDLIEANQVSNKIARPSTCTWSAAILVNAKTEQPKTAFDIHHKLPSTGLKSDKCIYLATLKACSLESNLLQGRYTHVQIIESGLRSDIFLGNTLIDMYAKCDSLKEAYDIFQDLPKYCLVSWNVMISGYAQHGDGISALELFDDMQQAGMNAEKITFLGALKACAHTGCLEQGRLIHNQIIKNGFHLDDVVGTTVLDMYVKCGSLREACRMFCRLPSHNVVSWSIIIAGYAEYGEGYLALKFYKQMQQEGIEPNNVTFLSALKACTGIGAIDEGRVIHHQIVKDGLEADVNLGSALVDMYAKCGSLEEACEVFETLPNRNVVSWGAMIAGYVHHGEDFSALQYFEKMQQVGIQPDGVIFLSILKACASLGAIDHGRLIHYEICKTPYHLDVLVSNTVVYMYAQCGSLDEARVAFHHLSIRNVVSWGAIIAGYAQHGDGIHAIEYFEKMQQDRIPPDDAAFTNILVACSRQGLVEEGRWYLKTMIDDHGILPDISHCTSMSDLLGRSGCLGEAEGLLWSIARTNVIGWTSLLSACKMHGNVEIGRRCFDRVVHLDCSCAAAYVLMANIYSDAQMQDDACKIERMRLIQLYGRFKG